MVTVMAAGWANYLSPLVWPEGFTIKGQSLAIIIPIVLFPISAFLWLFYRGTRAQNPWVGAFLIGLAVAWPIHMLILRAHGDQYPHVVWLFIPVLAMLYFKAPNASEAWLLVKLFGWLAVLILITTRALETVGVLSVFRLDPAIIQWEKERYWIPLSGYLGLDGRWPGPFGYNSKTGFIGALLVIIGLASRSRSTWVFAPLGIITLLVTGSRGSMLSAAVGILVLLTFAMRGPITRIPLALRTTAAGISLVLVGWVFLRNPVGTTGRFGEGGIWDAFISLWQSSPWIGVGQVGILADPQASISMEAHNLFLQHLTRFGIVGITVQYLVIAIALGIMAVAAYRGLSWPLAIAAAYYVASLTEVLQDGWLQHTPYSLLLILGAMAAGSHLSRDDPRLPITPQRNGEPKLRAIMRNGQNPRRLIARGTEM
jgi:hypothetical protein